MESFDQGMWNWFQSRRTPGLDSAMMAISLIGTPRVLAVVVILLGAALLWRRQLLCAGVVGATFLISFVLVQVFQMIIGRERPEVAYRPLEMPINLYSFPSEHAWLAAATYLAAAWGIADLLPRMRWLLLSLAGLLALGVGMSRLFIGVCYPTDVIAGWLAGFCLALLLRTAAKPNLLT